MKIWMACLLMMLTANVNAQSLWERFTGWAFGTKTITASDNIITKTVDLEDFRALRVLGSIDVTYIQETDATHPRVVITGPDNIVDIVVVNQEGENLSVHYKSNTYFRLNNKPFKVEVYSADIRSISLGGSGDLRFDGIRVGDFSLSLSGSGDVEGRNIISTGDVSISLAGSGDVECRNVNCFDLTVHVAGSGDVEVKDINSQSVSASIAGSGDIQLDGKTEKANYQVTGSGDIDARGLKAEEVSKSKAGSGNISS